MGSACAKVILFGEHAVVYGEPGIAVPVPQLRISAEFSTDGYTQYRHDMRIISDRIGLNSSYSELDPNQPIRRLLDLLKTEFGLRELPHKILTIHSDIPPEAGLGSGAASSIAIIRTFSEETGKALSAQRVSELAFEIEKIYHGTPSGIDNLVIATGQPVFYRKGHGGELLTLKQPLPLIIANSGINSPTREVVGDIRANFSAHELTIREIGKLAAAAKTVLLENDLPRIADLMNENQRLLERLSASCEKLNHLIEAARKAGASGAKLTGAGRGGNLIALYRNEADRARIKAALTEAGATIYV